MPHYQAVQQWLQTSLTRCEATVQVLLGFYTELSLTINIFTYYKNLKAQARPHCLSSSDSHLLLSQVKTSQ